MEVDTRQFADQVVTLLQCSNTQFCIPKRLVHTPTPCSSQVLYNPTTHHVANWVVAQPFALACIVYTLVPLVLFVSCQNRLRSYGCRQQLRLTGWFASITSLEHALLFALAVGIQGMCCQTFLSNAAETYSVLHCCSDRQGRLPPAAL